MQSCFWKGQLRGREAERCSDMLAGRRGEDGEIQSRALWEEDADRLSTLVLGVLKSSKNDLSETSHTMALLGLKLTSNFKFQSKI